MLYSQVCRKNRLQMKCIRYKLSSVFRITMVVLEPDLIKLLTANVKVWYLLHNELVLNN